MNDAINNPNNNPNNNPGDPGNPDAASDAFVREAARRLQASTDDLDSATLQRLQAARRAAVESLGPTRSIRPASNRKGIAWWPAAAAAAVSIVVVGLILVPSPRSLPPPAVESGQTEVLELMEDVDFYAGMDAALSGDPASDTAGTGS